MRVSARPFFKSRMIEWRVKDGFSINKEARPINQSGW